MSYEHKSESYKSLCSYAVVTEYLQIQLCMADHLESCLTIPICIDVPPLNGRQTLILALPFLPITSGLEEDILCPVHPLPGERCVDLLSCNHFRESVFANSVTICRRVSNGSSLEMCFHNITDIMNETSLHFFYSNLHCHPNGIRPQSTRTYIKSIKLLITHPPGTNMVNCNIK